jgi:hypothetical protein
MSLFSEWEKQFDKSKGLGDTVSKVIKTVSGGHISECGACSRRRDLLNRMVPYKDSK